MFDREAFEGEGRARAVRRLAPRWEGLGGCEHPNDGNPIAARPVDDEMTVDTSVSLGCLAERMPCLFRDAVHGARDVCCAQDDAVVLDGGP